MEDTSKAVEEQESAPAESEGVVPESPTGGEFVEPEQITEKVQARINKLTFEKHEERRRAEELENRLKELESKVSQPVSQPKDLKLEDFDYDNDKYTAALIEQRASSIVEQKLTEAQKREQQQRQQMELRQKQTEFNDKARSYAESNPEYVELIGSMGTAIQSETVADFLMSSDTGPKMQHHLLKDFSELSRIQSLPPTRQAIELARLEAKLSKPPVKEISKAPEPADTLDGGIDVNAKSRSRKGPRMPL